MSDLSTDVAARIWNGTSTGPTSAPMSTPKEADDAPPAPESPRKSVAAMVAHIRSEWEEGSE